MGDKVKKRKCQDEIQVLRDYREDIPEIVESLLELAIVVIASTT